MSQVRRQLGPLARPIAGCRRLAAATMPLDLMAARPPEPLSLSWCSHALSDWPLCRGAQDMLASGTPRAPYLLPSIDRLDLPDFGQVSTRFFNHQLDGTPCCSSTCSVLRLSNALSISPTSASSERHSLQRFWRFAHRHYPDHCL